MKNDRTYRSVAGAHRSEKRDNLVSSKTPNARILSRSVIRHVDCFSVQRETKTKKDLEKKEVSPRVQTIATYYGNYARVNKQCVHEKDVITYRKINTHVRFRIFHVTSLNKTDTL